MKMETSDSDNRRTAVEESSEEDFAIPPSPTFFCVQGTAPTMLPSTSQSSSRSVRRDRERTAARRARRSNNSRPRRSREHRSHRSNNGSSNNPYIVVVVPPSQSDTNNNSSNSSCVPNNLSSVVNEKECCSCMSEDSMRLLSRLAYLTCCEFMPWVFGSILIYFAYQSWGLTAAVTAFLFVMSTHGVFRWMKTKGPSSNPRWCRKPLGSQRVDNAAQPPQVRVTSENTESEEPSSDDSEDSETESETPYVPEAPPSYETATLTTEDSQKHLICHLTPTRIRQNLEEKVKLYQEELNNSSKKNFLTVPPVYFGRGQSTPATTDDEDDDFIYLPTYMDAVRRASVATDEEESEKNDDKPPEFNITIEDIDNKD